MRTFALTVFALSLLGGSAAFAAATSTGDASTAPTFAPDANSTAVVVAPGDARTPPAIVVPDTNGQVVVDPGTASKAPVFAPAQ
jgi:hypothetical protein